MKVKWQYTYRSFATTASQLKICDFSGETFNLKCYTFLWVQRRHNRSPAASFANCVMTLYLLKVHLPTFLSIPIILKCQILSCDTLVANERYTLPCENSQRSVCISCTFTVNLSNYVYSWTTVQKDQSMHLVCKWTVVSVLFFLSRQPKGHNIQGQRYTTPCLATTRVLQLNTIWWHSASYLISFL